MSAPEAEAGPGAASAAMVRAAIFLAFWLMIAGRDLDGLPNGVAAAAAAAWTSLRLMPPGA